MDSSKKALFVNAKHEYVAKDAICIISTTIYTASWNSLMNSVTLSVTIYLAIHFQKWCFVVITPRKKCNLNLRNQYLTKSFQFEVKTLLEQI